MDALFLSFSLSRRAGGILEVECSLAHELQKLSVSVHAVGLSDSDWPSDRKRWEGISASVFPVIGPRVFGFAPGMGRAVYRESQHDILHLHGLWMYPSVVACKWATKYRRMVIVSPHGMLDPWALKNSGWKKMLAGLLYERRNLRAASCLHALCQTEANSIRRIGLKNPVAIIPNGIDLHAKSVGDPPWKNMISQGRNVLLFLSRIHPKKGLAPALRAWAEIQNSKSSNQHSTRWVFAIAGWNQGGHEAELKLLCSELGIRWADISSAENTGPDTELASLFFLGPQFNEAKAACYGHCDGFILPSFSEGVPMVILEAWAHKKAVMMTPECNLAAGFEREAAVRVEANPESIAGGLRKFFEMTDGEREAMGRRGRRLVEEEFAWPKVAEQMKALYGWVLGGGPKPGFVDTSCR